MGNSHQLIPEITLKKFGNKYQSGHLWIFSNELKEVPRLEPGTIVDVIASDSTRLGLAFYNPNSLIALRLLMMKSINDFKDTIIRRIALANKRRLLISDKSNTYRMVFGESDFLPGLIIDRYENYYVIQIQSAGFERIKSLIVESLLNINPSAKGIILKANSKSREIEGLGDEDEVLFGEIPDIISIPDSGLELKISLTKGQKTGFFLDQRDNRNFLKNIAFDKNVLDCFTNIGGFALSAALGGAKSITAIDISESAIELARMNAATNKFNINFICSDVFDYLANNQGCQWDIIILDPPAFAKNIKSIPTAKAAYEKLNKIALSLLLPGGILLTSSCSHHIFEDVFEKLILNAARKSGVKINLIYRGSQATDHPIYPPMHQTKYLKFYAYQVLEV